MSQRSTHVGVWLVTIASLLLWYALAWAAQALVDLGAGGITRALGAWDVTPAHWHAALNVALPTIADVIDGLIWTLWLLGSIGLVLAAAYAAWLLQRGAWADRTAPAGHRRHIGCRTFRKWSTVGSTRHR